MAKKRRRRKAKKGMMGSVFFALMGGIILPVYFMLSHSGLFERPVPVVEQNMPNPWPPVVGQRYPDLELIDPDGGRFRLSQLRGKVIIIEPTGMNCPACQAFSGAHEYGAYENNPVQEYVESVRAVFPRYANGLKLPNRDIIFVQLLLYDMKLGKPTVHDALKWAQHFNIYQVPNYYVAVAVDDLRGDVSFNMIPGFQLIDQNFILRADSTGHRPKADLYSELIPSAARLVLGARVR
ncbi:MAG: peroxiredoxin family protein [Alphaproteobacteria bacterium]